MARRKISQSTELDTEASLLDVVDSVLNKGVVVNGDVILGLANVDLIYAKLSVLLAALDRIMEPAPAQRGRRGKPSRRKGVKTPRGTVK